MGPNPQVFSQDLTWLFLFSRSYSQILFEVWRKNDSSSVICISPRSFKFFSSLAQLFHSSFRCASIILGGVSRRHLKTEEEFYLHILSVLSEIRDSSSSPSSHNCFWLSEFFSPIRSNSRFCSVWLSGAHHLRFIHSSFQLSYSKSYRCLNQGFSNQLVISSFSWI